MATYYDALNRVFRLFKERRTPAAPQLVMCWILQEHNRLGNPGQVELSDRELISVTGYSKDTITDSKRILKSLGLIDFHSKRGKPTIYKLPLFGKGQSQGQSQGQSVGQSVGQSSRFSIPSKAVKSKDEKTKDAPVREEDGESDNSWLYVKVAQKQKGADNDE